MKRSFIGRLPLIIFKCAIERSRPKHGQMVSREKFAIDFDQKTTAINKLLAAEEARNSFANLMKMKMNIEDDSLNLI